MNNLVSVIVPVYNSEKYIGKCLDSILAQTYQEIEVLAINDGSKDNSLAIMKQYEEQYPNKVKAISQENKGVATTRNESIAKATGKYILFVDNDDYLDKEYIETFVKAIESGDYDAVIGGFRRPDENGKIVRTLKLENKEWSKLMIMAPWAKIFKKDYLVENQIQFLPNNLGEDVYFNLKAMLLSNKIKIIDYVGYNWYFNTASVSNSKQKNMTELQVYELLNSCYDMLKTTGILEKKHEMVETYLIRYAVWILSFSTKKLPYKTISQEYDKLFSWLEERFPEYRKCSNISFTKPDGEAFGVRVFTKLFMICHNLHLAKFMTYLYSRF